MTDKKLDWKQTEPFEWRAISSIHDDGDHFEWVIVTHEIGGGNDNGIIYFCAGNSTPELLPDGADEMVFRRLNDIQRFCEILENHQRNICDIETKKITADAKSLAAAMQSAWDEHCADTACYPDFLEVDSGRCTHQAQADFTKGNFASDVAMRLRCQPDSIDESQIPSDVLAKHTGDA